MASHFVEWWGLSVYDSSDYSYRIALHCGYYLANLLILFRDGNTCKLLSVPDPDLEIRGGLGHPDP